MKERASEPHVYIAIEPCGCRNTSITDDPRFAADVRAWTDENRRPGVRIERVHADDERNRLERCEQHKRSNA